MAKCAKCGSEVTGDFCPSCGTPVQNNGTQQQPNQPGGQQQFSQPNQFGGQQQFNQPNQFGGPQQFNQPNQFGGPQQFNQPNRFGEPQQFNQPNQFGGTMPYNKPQSNVLGIVASVLLILNALIILIATIPMFKYFGKEMGVMDGVDMGTVSAVYAVIFMLLHAALAAAAVIMLLVKKQGFGLIAVILQAVLVIVSIIVLVASGFKLDDMASGYDVLFGSYDKMRNLGAAFMGTLSYLIANSIGGLFWLAGFILTIISTATYKKR